MQDIQLCLIKRRSCTHVVAHFKGANVCLVHNLHKGGRVKDNGTERVHLNRTMPKKLFEGLGKYLSGIDARNMSVHWGGGIGTILVFDLEGFKRLLNSGYCIMCIRYN